MATKLSRTLSQLPIASSSRLFSTSSIASNSSSSSSEVPAQPTGDASPLPFSYNDFKGPEYPEREPLRRTHSIPVAHLTLSAHHPYNLDLYSQFAWHSAQSLGIPAARPAPLKKRQELITVIKAPFVHKKYQENFERRHHHRQIVAYDANKEVVDLWLRYVKQNRIGGVGLKATVYEWVEPGFGEKEIEGLKAQLEKPDSQVLQEATRLLKEMGEGKLIAGSVEDLSGQQTTEEASATEPSSGSISETPLTPTIESETGASASSETATEAVSSSTEAKETVKEQKASGSKVKKSSKDKEVKETPAKTEAKSTKAKSPSKIVKSVFNTDKSPEASQESVDQRSIGETEASISDDLPTEAKETAQKP